MAGKLAFLVLAHDDPVQLVRLCERLAPWPVIVHCDAKASALDTATLPELENVTYCSRRHSVDWAGFSMVEATLTLLEAARNVGLARHTMLLSGHCYPIKPMFDLAAMLDRQTGKDLIRLTRIERASTLFNQIGRHWRQQPLLPRWLGRIPLLDKADLIARRIRNRLARELSRDIAQELGGVPVYHGSQWWCLSDRSIEAILEFDRKNPRFRRAFRSTFAPDEMFFHTLIAAAGRTEGHQLEADDLQDDNLYCAPLHHVHRDNDRWIADSNDLRMELGGSDKFFARKIASGEAALLDWIDSELLGIDGRSATLSPSEVS